MHYAVVGMSMVHDLSRIHLFESSKFPIRMKTLFRQAFIAQRFSEQELDYLQKQIGHLRYALNANLGIDPLHVSSFVASFYLYASTSEAGRIQVNSFVDSFFNADTTIEWSPEINLLSEQIYAELQWKRIGNITEKINQRKSLTGAVHHRELVSSINDSRLTGLYENRVDELNIDFTVNVLPFPFEVLDPRIVRVKPGKSNEMHRHAHETIFIFMEGSGKVLVDEFENIVNPGDFAFIPRWSNHQSINTGEVDLVFLAVADFGLTGKSFMGNYLKTARLKEQ